jgi:hypothetical protein
MHNALTSRNVDLLWCGIEGWSKNTGVGPGGETEATSQR